MASKAEAPQEALAVCPECQAAVPPRLFEMHLRRQHGIYQFRGQRGSRAEVLAALVVALVRPNPDREAWDLLADLVQDEEGERAPEFVGWLLGPALAGQGERREQTLTTLASLLAGWDGAAALAVGLAEGEPGSRELALAILAETGGLLDPVRLQVLRALLPDRALSAGLQVRALAACLPRLRGQDVLASGLLELLVFGLSRTRALERLRQVEALAGKQPVLEEVRARQDEKVRMSCPRCSVELRREDMIPHLWEKHRLVLDGRKVREPWAAVERWVEACRQQFDPELLDRCRFVAGQLGEDGSARLYRLLLARGLADPESRRLLLEEARRLHCSRCPWCYALVSLPRELPPLEIRLREGRLRAGGYAVEVRESGLRPALLVRTPEAVLYEGREPRQRLTEQGALLLVAGPLVFLALLWAILARRPLPTVAGLDLLALSAGGAVWLAWQVKRPGLPRRVLRHAWTVLASRLHEKGFKPEDSAFLAGLARHALEAGVFPRVELLRDLIGRTEPAVQEGKGAPGHLAMLRLVQVRLASQAGEDPLPLIVHQVARCFEGGLPLSFAQHFLEGCGRLLPAEVWPRLRVLLCDRAFEAGFEVCNLLDAGQAAPELGAALGCQSAGQLAGLRLLWSLRPGMPWERLGEVATAFALAADPRRSAELAAHPDVLLWQELPEWELLGEPGALATGEKVTTKQPNRPARVMMTLRGVWLQGALFTSPPRVVEVRTRGQSGELRMGEQVFRGPGDLEGLARHLERWFRYAFHEFLPQVSRVETWQSPDRAAILRVWGAVGCPECGRFLLPRLGEVGLALDEVEG